MRHFAAVVLAAAGAAAGADFEEFRVKPEQVFEFAAAPTVSRDGDRVTIAFETKGLCDVTVAVEDGGGRIVRHLACGVLGPSAPEPFAKDSKAQRIVWDGKDDQGRYVDDPTALTIRVSLGLRARFERALNAHPIKLPNYRAEPGLLAAAPEGVYVFTTGAGVSFLRLFDHEGNYVRTVYPFPAERIGEVRGILRRRFPQTGLEYPLKWGLNQNTFLTGGTEEAGVGWPESESGDPAFAMAVGGGRIALVHQRVGRLRAWLDSPPEKGSDAEKVSDTQAHQAPFIHNRSVGVSDTFSASDPGESSHARLGTGGDSGGLDLVGPKASFPLPMSRMHTFPGGVMRAHARSAAFSPDGRTLYLAGYFYSNAWVLDTLAGVAKVAFDAGRDASAEVFLGRMTKNGGGKGAGEFSFPASVACDAAGRVYVADYLNDRVQVFSPEGKLLRSVPISKPLDLAIHQRTGELYVFSRLFRNTNLAKMQEELDKIRQRIRIPPTMTRLAPFEEGSKVRATCPLPVSGETYGEFGHPGEYIHVALDSWAEPATVWITDKGNWRGGENEIQFPRLYVERDGRLVPKRDYVAEVRTAVGRTLSPRHGRVRVYCNPADGKLYCGESHTLNAKSFCNLVRFDPATGAFDGIVELPFHSEDLAFDRDGQFYLRTDDLVARYRLRDGRLAEVPFDYGVERKSVGYSPHAGMRFAHVTSGIELPSVRPGYWIMGGLYVSPRGRIAVACHNPGPGLARVGEDAPLGQTPAYKPPVYPGRPIGWEIHVWDDHGTLLYADAIPGSRQMFGIGMDHEDALYCMTPSRQILADGRPYPNDVSCLVFKARPGAARFVSAGGDGVPVPLGEKRPTGPPSLTGGLYSGNAWLTGAQWTYGGVGNAAKYIGRAGGGCWCQYAQMTLDGFARTFVPEPDIYSVAVLDSAGNLVLRIGRYGNPDDGVPAGQGADARGHRPIGGDEVALFDPQHVATDTDRRLFISDIANGRVASVRLEYHRTERVKVPATSPAAAD